MRIRLLRMKRRLLAVLLFLLLSAVGVTNANAQAGALNGLFTINENGDQVRFSQGNLQYQASTHTWRFAENQWDYVGEDNANISETYDGWIDLFGWGTSGYNHGADCYQPWGNWSNCYANCVYGDMQYNLYDQTGQADWGYNPISNGGNVENSGWRTLRQPEWEFIFNERNTTSGIRFAKVIMNGVKGVVLLPDNWSVSIYSFSDANVLESDYESNIISFDDWTGNFEGSGAVFLPVTGWRVNGTEIWLLDYGFYWTSSAYTDDNGEAKCVCFGDENWYSASNNLSYRSLRCWGCSVRLVRPAESSTHGYINLGLPSGTLWATCNVGANSPEEYGDYFAWGETTPKEIYNWDTYQYCINGNSWDILTKYCYDSYYGYEGFTDDLTTLLPEDDAAAANWGNNWRMPTKEEFEELYNNTTMTWTQQNDVNGRLFTAANGNSLFLPAAGYRWGDEICLVGTANSAYWSSSLGTVYSIYAWDFIGAGNSVGGDSSREVGRTVRPVRENLSLVTVTATANPTEGGSVSGGGIYTEGATCTLTATPNEGYTFINWTENGEVVSRVATYSFTVMGDRDLVANFAVSSGNNHSYVDLDLPSGTLWATCNVGANSPEEYGDYFAWGETAPKDTYDWSTYQYGIVIGDWEELKITKYCSNASWGYEGFTDNLTTLLSEDDAATANWGNGWRMPTKEEFQELYSNTTMTWTQQNGVNGSLFTASNGNSLFLPATGERWFDELYDIGSNGRYWASSLNTDYPGNAEYFIFNSDYYSVDYSSRDVGHTVRPVRENLSFATVTATANPAEGGTVSGGGAYEEGATCTLTATPNEGYTFVNWTENGEVVSSEATYSFTVTGNRDLVANFVEGNVCAITFDLDDSCGDSWNGNYLVVSYGDITEQLTLEDGSYASYALQIPDGSHVELTWISGSWIEECSFTVSYSNGNVIYQGSDLNDDFSYGFDVDCEEMPATTFDITASAVPEEGGTIEDTGEYDCGTECTLTAIPNQGYVFSNWTENGEVVSTDASYSFFVNGNRELVANFLSLSQLLVSISDDFNDGVINPDYWIASGPDIIEEDGMIKMQQNETDAYVALESVPMRIPSNNQIVIERSFLVHEQLYDSYWGEHYFYGSLNIRFNGSEDNFIGIGYNDDDYENRHGTYLMIKQDGEANETRICDATFDTWLEEKVVVDLSNETLTYYLSDTLVATLSIEGVSNQQMGYYTVWFNPYGWWTGHQHYMDYVNINVANEHQYVDLGLPSGTLWATCNVGANSPEEYGDYFAWGETTPKDYYDWSTYQYCMGSDNTFTKYCNNADYGYNGFTDNLIILLPEDDASMANWGNDWRMPTQAEWQELYNNTTHTWTTQNGVYGRLFTASNGNSLFLPAAGHISNDVLNASGVEGYYWSNSLNTDSPYNSWGIYFLSFYCNMAGSSRELGRSVRPVRNAQFVINATADPEEGGTVDFGGFYNFEDQQIPSNWNNDANYPWVITTPEFAGYNGSFCMMSGNAGVHSSTSSIEVTVDFAEDGTISFLAGCWGEGNDSWLWDKCKFFIDDNEQFNYGALQSWNSYSYEVTAGTHTFRWSYSKDGSVHPTGDAFFVDDVSFSGANDGTSFYYGQTCTLVAKPNVGYGFVEWTKNGTQVSTNAIYTFTVTENTDYVAHFFQYPSSLSDDFNDGEINPDLWIATGNNVYEEEGLLKMDQNVTDQNVSLLSKPIQLTPDNKIVVERSFYVHKNNDYCYGGFAIEFNGETGIHGRPLHADSWDGSIADEWGVDYIGVVYGYTAYEGKYGIYVENGLGNTIQGTRLCDVTFDTWQTEKVVIDLTAGLLSYYLNGVYVGTVDIPELTTLAVNYYTTIFSPWGWWTGHQQYMDYININTDLDATYTVNASANPAEGGTVNGGGTFQLGQTCAVTAMANEGYTFMYWTSDDNIVSYDAEFSFSVALDCDLVANFSLPFTITAEANPMEGGTITGAGDYDYGTTCTMSAVANENYTFMYWTEDGTQVSNDIDYTFTVTSNRNLVAHFALPFTVSASANLVGSGTIEGLGEYDYNTTCTLTAIPNEGYLFQNWSKNGEIVSCNATYSFTVTEDVDLEAVFMLLEGTLVGEGEETNVYLPSYSYYNYTLSQQIYTPDEIGTDGCITSISYYNEGGTKTRNYDIYMVHTDKSTFENDTDWITVSEADLVFSGEVTMTKGYWNIILLDTPFEYNGTSNLVIIVDDNSGNWSGNSMTCRVFNTEGNQAIRVYSDNTNYDPMSPPTSYATNNYPAVQSVKNQVIFRILPLYHFVTSGTWGNASNWSGGVLPGANDAVSIDANCALNNDVEVAALTVTSGETLTLRSGKTLTVTGALANRAASGLVIKEGAQLVNGAENVAATVEKNVFAYDGASAGWYTIASPMNGMAIAGSDFVMHEYDLYRFNETNLTNEEWENHKADLESFDTFEKGRGYLYANNYSFTPAFTGILNASAVTYSLTCTNRPDDPLSGFNLIGNPFPHEIYKGAGGAIDNLNLASGYYTLDNDGTWQVHSFDDAILPGQGILVKANAPTDLTIAKSTEEAYSESGDAKKEMGRLSISLTGDGGRDRAYVYFGQGIGLDKRNDLNAQAPSLWIRENGKDYAITHANDIAESLELCFSNKQAGDFTLTVKASNAEFEYLQLIDHLTGLTVNLLKQSTYRFHADGQELEARFSIKYKLAE